MSNNTVVEKIVNEDLEFMMKAGLHHFMELEERTDLLTVSSEDPLENTIVISLDDSEDAVISDDGIIHFDADSNAQKLCEGEGCDYEIVIEKDNVRDEKGKMTEDLQSNVKVKETVTSEEMVVPKRTKPRKRRKNGVLLRQSKKIEKKLLACQICNVQKESLKELNQHFNEHIRKTDNKFECTLCGDAVDTYGSYIEHIKSHKDMKKKKAKKSFRCDICNKLFQFKCLLKDHKNLHTGYRPYLCSNCGKAFSLKASLKQHSRIHGTVKKHKCVYCDFSVYVKADLIKHIRTHTGERPYICEICGEGYIQSSHLVVHKRSHSGERPYKCDLCNRGFTKKGDVIRHRRIHTGELPYLCQVCGKAFRQSTQCSNHVKHHHPGTVDGKINVPGYIPHNHAAAKALGT